MVVSSGGAPYEYVSSVANSAFHFRVPVGKSIAPSSVLLEEALFVLKAEYNRLGAGGAVFGSTTLDVEDGFSLFLSDHTSGVFDPDPSGRRLGGIIPTELITNAGGSYSSYTPASYNFKAYIAQAREVLREILAEVSSDAGGNLSHWEMVEDWIKYYKNYRNDSPDFDGLFLEEVEDVIANSIHSSGIFSSGFSDRHLNEIRYQPIPHLSGFGGSFNFETKPEMTLRPFKPVYWNTNGQLGPLWTSGEAFGDVLVQNVLAIVLSGGGTSGNGNNTYVVNDWKAESVNSIPISGNFSPLIGMANGVYISVLGSSGTALGTGLLPWGTGLNNFARVVRMPNGDANLPESGGQQYAVYISDNVWGVQVNTAQTSISESGLQWRRPLHTIATQVDLYVTYPSDSGTRLKWGNSLYAKIHTDKGTNDLYRPGGWAYDRTNDVIVLPASSGFISIASNYFAGTGLFTTWNPDMELQSSKYCGLVSTPADGQNFAVMGLESVTDDGSNFICHGYVQPQFGGVSSGCLWKINSSFNPIDFITTTYEEGLTFYHRGQSEYLFLSNSGSSRRTLEEVPNRFFTSGTYFTVSLTWGDISSPPGSMNITRYIPDIAPAASSLWNLIGNGHTQLRIVNFFNEEGTDDLYGMALAFPAGALSGNGNNMSRYIIKLDDSVGHPYTISDAWLLGGDSSLNNLDSSIRNANFTFFADDFQF